MINVKWTVDLHFTISCVDFTLGQPPSAWFMPWLTKSALIVFTWWQKTYMFSPDLKKSKILGWFHLIFWSNSSTLDNARHRILGHVLAFGGQMCSSLVFLWNSEETNFENKKSRMSYSWALDQARLLPWPFLKFNFIEHGCSSKRLTLLVIELYWSVDLPRKYLINIPNIQMWNGIKLTIMFKILLSCFSWWCQAWSPVPSLLARHWERARCIFTITTAMLTWFLTY